MTISVSCFLKSVRCKAPRITDKFSGQSKGFGFVEMSSAEEVANAIRQFNETELKGRNIKVNEARPRESGLGGGNRERSGGRGGRGGNRW